MPILFKYLNADGSFDLSAAVHERCANYIGKPSFKRAIDFIDEIEDITRIHNPEAAAIAYAYAASIARSAT